MFRLTALIAALAVTGPVSAACPDYLEHSMRKLHSKQQINLCELQAGRPMLVINTASHCGYTRQFTGLEGLHQKYGEQGLVVVGFASDDFNQEARDEASTAEVCYVNYGVTFTMIAPSHVKGEQANPVFSALGQQAGAPSWNFNKYLVDPKGLVVQKFDSNTSPDDKALQAAIESLL